MINNDNNDKKLNVELMPVVKNNGAKGGYDEAKASGNYGSVQIKCKYTFKATKGEVNIAPLPLVSSS